MKKISVVLAAAVAALLFAGCVSMEEYNRVAEDRDSLRYENDTLADQIKLLEGQKQQVERNLVTAQKAKVTADGERDVAAAKIRDLTEQLKTSQADGEKAKHELTLAQEEIKMTLGKVKDLEKKVGELTDKLAKVSADGEKAKEELQATIQKLTMELNDAHAQIAKLEEAAREVKAEPVEPETKVAPEKVTEPKPVDINKGPGSFEDRKVRDTKGSSKAEKQ